MVVLRRVKAGVRYALAGDFGPIVSYVRGWPRWLRDEIRDCASTPIETVPAPSWTSTDSNSTTLRLGARPGSYLAVLDDQDEPHVFDFPEPIDEIDVVIVTPASDRSTKVKGEFETTTGASETRKISVPTGNRRPSHLPLTLSFDTPIVAGSLSLTSTLRDRPALVRTTSTINRWKGRRSNSALSLPAPRATTDAPPIVLLSIDTLRYDYGDAFEPVVKALGDDVIVPSEPRTQGHWTPPAHASMFTGVHPGTHLYLGWGPEGENHTIRPDLVTLPELLADNLYKCSATAARARILPEFGFGRCCHRFELNGMTATDWITRETDARTQVETLTRWMDEDVRAETSNRLFYFGHFFDPHAPYLPPPPHRPDEELDIEDIFEFRDDPKGPYLERYAADPVIEDEKYDQVLEFYRRSVAYTATQVVRVLDHLKSLGIFEESLIIVTGDHGEEFGERGFYGHNSLYDANIRPFMAIKPPASADWPKNVEAVDHVDILPTIATLLDVEVPDQCQGRAIQDRNTGERPRFTERIRPDAYSVSIEVDERKAIFTYPDNYPYRPSSEQISEGPILREFYDVTAVRSGEYEDIGGDLSTRETSKFEELAERFVTSDRDFTASYTTMSSHQETEQLLRDLGYM